MIQADRQTLAERNLTDRETVTDQQTLDADGQEKRQTDKQRGKETDLLADSIA